MTDVAAPPLLEPNRVYTAEQVADAFQVHPSFVRKQISAGELHCHRLGRNIRIKGKDALTWFESRSTKSTDTASADIEGSTSSAGTKGRLNVRDNWV